MDPSPVLLGADLAALTKQKELIQLCADAGIKRGHVIQAYGSGHDTDLSVLAPPSAYSTGLISRIGTSSYSSAASASSAPSS